MKLQVNFHEGNKRSGTCYSMKKGCSKYHAWRAKKEPYILVYYRLIELLHPHTHGECQYSIKCLYTRHLPVFEAS